MQLVCEGHPAIRGISEGIRPTLQRPTVLEEPVLKGDSDGDAYGCSIYGSVIRDGGTFRMWYQAWPRDWEGSDVITVGCVESDDGVTWRRPDYGLVPCCGSRRNHLTDLPFHCPSVLIDPDAPADARYRAFGYADPARLKGRYACRMERNGYFTAFSGDGIHWGFDSPRPAWEGSDVITSAWDPAAGCARIALKRSGQAAGMYRRKFATAEWRRGQAGPPASALVPDDYDDVTARARGFDSGDYYGMGWMPTEGPTIGFLWNFRHQRPLGYHERGMFHYGRIGRVDLSVVYQVERGGRWLHVAGRPDWLCAEDAPAWARGAIYTASSPIHVGDETWLYLTGTGERHAWCGAGADVASSRKALVGRGGFARIGLAKWPRNRVIGYGTSLPGRMQIAPSPGRDPEGGLTINAVTRPGGRIRAALLDSEYREIPGYGMEDCDGIAGDHLEAAMAWRGRSRLPAPPDRGSVTAMLEIVDGVIYAFEFAVPAGTAS